MYGSAPDVPRFVSTGQSHARDVDVAAAEVLHALDLDHTRFILAFIPEHLDATAVCHALNRQAPDVPVFGCTTAGQITSEGYESDALLLLGFPKRHFRCASILFENLHPYSATSVAERARGDNGAFLHTAGWNRLGLIFADGVSKQEDLLISTLETILEGVPIFGGSAGDGLQFEQTFVLCNGQAHKNAAVLLLIETDLAFEGLGFDHFQPVGNPLVITAADPDARVVYEINGSPAAVEYARLVGCDVDQLSPEVFAANPLLLEHHQRHYARAISDAAPDHALSFLAAIDDGLVLKLGRGTEVIDTLRNGLDFSDAHDGRPDFVLGFDCVLRLLEFQQKKLSAVVSETLAAARVFGFNTYGEQHVGLHMNHTFVGVAFYPPGRGTELQ